MFFQFQKQKKIQLSGHFLTKSLSYVPQLPKNFQFIIENLTASDRKYTLFLIFAKIEKIWIIVEYFRYRPSIIIQLNEELKVLNKILNKRKNCKICSNLNSLDCTPLKYNHMQLQRMQAEHSEWDKWMKKWKKSCLNARSVENWELNVSLRGDNDDTVSVLRHPNG